MIDHESGMCIDIPQGYVIFVKEWVIGVDM